MHRITTDVEFDYGHRIPNHNSKCYNVHGHRGKIVLTLEGILIPEGGNDSSEGMVQDFGFVRGRLKALAELFDHKMIVAKTDTAFFYSLSGNGDSVTETAIGTLFFYEGFGKIQVMDGVPTAENLAKLVYDLMAKQLLQTIKVVSVQWWETPHCMAEYLPTMEPLKDYELVTQDSFGNNNRIVVKNGVITQMSCN